MSTFETDYRSYGTAVTVRVSAFMSAAGAKLLASLAGVAAARRARRTALVLHELTDTELKDIGLTRFDIDHIIRMRPALLDSAPSAPVT